MAIWHEQKTNCFVVHIDETDLTEEILDRMRQVLTVAFLSRQYNLVLDLGVCKMIDSYFIGLLISTLREVKELGGSLKCAGVTGQIQNAFEVIRLNQVIEIYDSVEKAIEDFEALSETKTESSDIL